MKNFVGSLLSLVAFTGSYSWAVPATQTLNLDGISSIENQVQAEVMSRDGSSGEAGVRREAAEKTVNLGDANAESISELGLNGIYKFKRSVFLTPSIEFTGGFFHANTASESIRLNEGEPVLVEFDSLGDAVIHLLLVDEEQGVIPDQLYVPAKEMEKAQLEFIEEGDEEKFHKDYSPFEETEEVSGQGFSRKGRLHFRGATGCVAYVIRAIGWRGPIGNGHKVTSTLMKHGWKRLSSCKNPPVGAVASWSGGGHGAGHTAIWNGKGWCYDKGCHDPGQKYRFLNCVQKPSAKKK